MYTADFETTTNPNDCRVWAWGVCNIDKPEEFEYGNSIDSFMDFLFNSGNGEFYFHNLKFDAEFIFVWLFEHGFKHTKDKKERASKTFNTLISDMGQFYSVEIVFEIKGKKTRKAKLYDSLKIIPFSVEQVAKGFGLPISKLDLDYTAFREKGHVLTDDEIAYLRNDVEIMARALAVLFKQNLTKITQASNAMSDYKAVVGGKAFERWFPETGL